MRPVYQDPGATPKIVGVNWDVTADVALNEDLKRAKRLTEARNAELEAAKARIEHNALHDTLTGLPNRRYLDEELKRHAARCATQGRASRCSISTSTASSRSTTRSAMPPATPC